MSVLYHHVDGAPVPPDATAWQSVYNPASGAVLTQTPLDDVGAVDRAVAAARTAYPAWAATPILQRARLFIAVWERLQAHRGELARLITEEHGKTLKEADAELGRGLEVVELAIGAPSLLKGEVLTDVARGIDTELIRCPLGVVVGITPFNFPAMIPLWMVPLAVVAGNTFVLKPSERTPRTALRLVELMEEAGVPAGVVNVVHGGAPVVDRLLAHPDVRAVSFVGSQPVAEHVYRTAAAAGKRVQALGGAKNYHVVMPDAVLPAAVEALTESAFGSAGERCLAGSVVLAVGEVAEPLLEALLAAADRMRIGSGLDPDTRIGPLIRAEHRDRVAGYIDRGIAEGARLLRDGRQGLPPGGYFLGPTVFDAVTSAMTIAQEEIFGPVLSVMRMSTLEEAVAVANRSRFGNTATIYTQSGAAARYFREHIEAGMVGINVGVAAPVAVFPFSGWKHSFYGDLHATGRDGLEFYTEKRVVTTRWW
jgi:malonate-semialdehyde dehydrogenase (acetylating)/methylmalonate-semialdehyde dehydrogenase